MSRWRTSQQRVSQRRLFQCKTCQWRSTSTAGTSHNNHGCAVIHASQKLTSRRGMFQQRKSRQCTSRKHTTQWQTSPYWTSQLLDCRDSRGAKEAGTSMLFRCRWAKTTCMSYQGQTMSHSITTLPITAPHIVSCEHVARQAGY